MEQQRKTAAARLSGALAWCWDQVMLPLVLVALTCLMGFGFFQGFMLAVNALPLTGDKVLVVRVIDLSADDE